MSEDARRVLSSYRVGGHELYLIGNFDTGVTVFSQQVRALNLVWALIESGSLPTRQEALNGRSSRVAIVGAGFSGLTAAAALIAKAADVDITIFEKRDTLLPLQQGSDSRWLHPRIYDWPGQGSESSVAMLPVLNWAAARASDVVVEILRGWQRSLTGLSKQPRLFCNSRHLQVHTPPGGSSPLHIEWIGEPRDPTDGTLTTGNAVGKSEPFDVIILAVGFGTEKDGALSYWRNENFGQPSLDQPRRTFLVSGQGDGAMIDLLRLRISQFRQDRILEELFAGKAALLGAVGKLHSEYGGLSSRSDLFEAMQRLEAAPETAAQFQETLQELSRRLRRDTDVMLRLNVKKLSELFDPNTSRISFQNKLLVYFLYKCGGFVPTVDEEDDILKRHGISDSEVVRRHGTRRDEQLRSLLASDLYEEIEARRRKPGANPFLQSVEARWPGGYFGIPGRAADAACVAETQRASWRKEYLPGPTQLMATSFCASVAGWLRNRTKHGKRLRVVLHRAIQFGTEELLQQTCEYQGLGLDGGNPSSAGRTFPARNATIGLAFRCKGIVRSKLPSDSERLTRVMSALNLHEASRKMSESVQFVAAIPLLEPEEGPPLCPCGVLGVLYIDSTDGDFSLPDSDMQFIVGMCEQFLEALISAAAVPGDRLRNVRLPAVGSNLSAEPLPEAAAEALELSPVSPPKSAVPLQLNFDFSDYLSAN